MKSKQQLADELTKDMGTLGPTTERPPLVDGRFRRRPHVLVEAVSMLLGQLNGQMMTRKKNLTSRDADNGRGNVTTNGFADPLHRRRGDRVAKILRCCSRDQTLLDYGQHHREHLQLTLLSAQQANGQAPNKGSMTT